jgi:uncharacterized Ntn-hydrolase superfamily protein
MVVALAFIGLSVGAAHATYSVTAYDPETGQLGVAVQSDTPWSGARVRYGMAGVAAIASQASSNPMMGEVGLTLIQRGFSPEEVRDMLVAMDNGAKNRQFAIVDTQGRSAGWTGEDNDGYAGHICQPNFCVEANTMTGPEVQNAMAIAYVTATKQGLPLVERLLAVLEAAEAAGGDRRGQESGGIMIFAQRTVADYGDHQYDIRVDDSDHPVAEMRRIYNVIQARNMNLHLADLIKAEDFDGAFAAIDKKLALDPGADDAWVTRASVYLAMKDVPSAINALSEAIKINPKLYFQILRDKGFATIWDNPDYQALGDYSKFHPLEPSVSGAEGMPMPAVATVQ